MGEIQKKQNTAAIYFDAGDLILFVGKKSATRLTKFSDSFGSLRLIKELLMSAFVKEVTIEVSEDNRWNSLFTYVASHGYLIKLVLKTDCIGKNKCNCFRCTLEGGLIPSPDLVKIVKDCERINKDNILSVNFNLKRLHLIFIKLGLPVPSLAFAHEQESEFLLLINGLLSGMAEQRQVVGNYFAKFFPERKFDLKYVPGELSRSEILELNQIRENILLAIKFQKQCLDLIKSYLT